MDVRLDGTSHPSGSRPTAMRLWLQSADPENLRFQAVSKGCLTEPMVTNQPLVAHDMGGQAVDDYENLGWNGWPIRNRGFLPTLPLVPRSYPLLIGITFLGQKVARI